MQVPGRIHTSASVDSFDTADALLLNDIHHNDSTSKKIINLEDSDKLLISGKNNFFSLFILRNFNIFEGW